MLAIIREPIRHAAYVFAAIDARRRHEAAAIMLSDISPFTPGSLPPPRVTLS